LLSDLRDKLTLLTMTLFSGVIACSAAEDKVMRLPPFVISSSIIAYVGTCAQPADLCKAGLTLITSFQLGLEPVPTH